MCLWIRSTNCYRYLPYQMKGKNQDLGASKSLIIPLGITYVKLRSEARYLILHKKWSFAWWISSVNVTKNFFFSPLLGLWMESTNSHCNQGRIYYKFWMKHIKLSATMVKRRRKFFTKRWLKPTLNCIFKLWNIQINLFVGVSYSTK